MCFMIVSKDKSTKAYNQNISKYVFISYPNPLDLRGDVQLQKISKQTNFGPGKICKNKFSCYMFFDGFYSFFLGFSVAA